MLDDKIISKQRNITLGEVISKYEFGGENIYVLLSAINNKLPSPYLALALSNNVIDLKSDTGSTITLKGHKKKITDIKFSNEDPSLFFSSSLDGYLCAWDVRCGNQPVQTFSDNSDEVLKPLTCFDFNLDERLICAGTEVVREDSFLLFWDRRTSKGLGGYWNCHTEEITQVRFHPLSNSSMASSCMDGLINIFDLNGSSEDEALLNTVNTGCCINKFCWRSNYFVSCLKSIEEYELWSIYEANPLQTISREYLSSHYQCKVDYLIDTLSIGDLFYLATGSYEGCIHLWQIDEKNIKSSYLLSNGHSQIVRTVCYNDRANTIISGGEDGLVCQWIGDFT